MSANFSDGAVVMLSITGGEGNGRGRGEGGKKGKKDGHRNVRQQTIAITHAHASVGTDVSLPPRRLPLVVSSGNDLGLQVEYNGSDSDESSSNDGHDQDGQGGGFGSMSSTRARDQGSSNAPVVSVALQTSPVDFLPLSEIELERALSTAAAPLRDSDSRVDSLAAFLLKVESLMDEALDEALTDSVFAAYARASSRDEVDAIELDKELVAAEFVALGVSAVAFSATGSMVAVGYGSSGHSAWCEHEAAIGVWAFNRSRSKSEVPEVLVRTRACVRALAFHPHAAGKLAYATFSGQVSVVDALAAGSGGNVGGGASDSSSGAVVATGVHTEPVVALEWLVVGSRSKAQSGGGHLVSLCAGGRLLMWDAASLSKTAVLGFTLHTSRLGSQLCPLGGSALALAAADLESGNLLVASETGALLQGSLTRHPALLLGSFAKPAASCEYPDDPYGVSPVVFAFHSPPAPVLALAASPFAANVFVSGAADGGVRLHALRTQQALMTRYAPDGSAVVAVQFSPLRPMVVFAGTSSGALLVFDLGAEPETPAVAHVLDAGITAIAANSEMPTVVSVGTTRGGARLYTVSRSLSAPRPGEEAQLQSTVAGLAARAE
ncbi:uncharacterized protein AMSG_04772 [Thecamonas trahens ATCC 50062]|uniref:Uncharacterized protein n=1 Tax=Thecamonas trahens ATCC 50062 TaxID=461836 RepID=A0A0L0DCJ3_THETB|nr:hypothetical protein AMSG_04772 [Thecamonas trahens ATCC 50062]KNC49028.1 hypothetical protein AMSG_04772 [Thecamonas trahens ATCC 50062]|eukprot:XP_013758438.1 hypothetical protein AMSG_04772 [Thecamonas trahens ATCC 50062]